MKDTTYMKQPLISVIIPVYNVEKYLDICLQSVTEQTYKNLEIILVNDGSQDNSGNICDSWAEKDTRIMVIHQKNGGPSKARNAGLEVFSGEYVMFVDSDDILDETICQVLYKNICDGVDIAGCGFVNGYYGKPINFCKSEQIEVMDAEQVISRMWYQNDYIPSAAAKLYRRYIFDDIRFTPGVIFEDIDMLHEIFWRANKISHNNSLLYGYMHREESITTAPFSTKDLYILEVGQKILDFASDKKSIQSAAISYNVAVALRVFLNAPNTVEFQSGIKRSKRILKEYGKIVLKDNKIRRKNKIALLMYFTVRPIMKYIYKYVDRWK